MRLYVNYKCSQKAETPTHQARNVSALEGRGGVRQGRGECGRVRQGGLGGHLSEGLPQEEVDRVTTVKAWYYSPEDYAKFTPAKKQKHFQLMRAMKAARNSGRNNNSSATVAELTTAISAVPAAALAISELTAVTTKGTAAECGETNDSDVIGKPKWGHNRNNPAVAGCQEHVPKKPKILLIGHSTLSAFHTTQLFIGPRRYITDLSTKIDSIGETTLELDSHADMCVLGRDALILLDYDRPVIVKGYDPSLGTKTYATVSGALAYDDPVTGKVNHLVINQAIHIPHLDHHLLCPMQC